MITAADAVGNDIGAQAIIGLFFDLFHNLFYRILNGTFCEVFDSLFRIFSGIFADFFDDLFFYGLFVRINKGGFISLFQLFFSKLFRLFFIGLIQLLFNNLELFDDFFRLFVFGGIV